MHGTAKICGNFHIWVLLNMFCNSRIIDFQSEVTQVKGIERTTLLVKIFNVSWRPLSFLTRNFHYFYFAFPAGRTLGQWRVNSCWITLINELCRGSLSLLENLSKSKFLLNITLYTLVVYLAVTLNHDVMIINQFS